jgi:hypothetical protein
MFKQVRYRIWFGPYDLLADERDPFIRTQPAIYDILRTFRHPVCTNSTGEQLRRPPRSSIPYRLYGIALSRHGRGYHARSLFVA